MNRINLIALGVQDVRKSLTFYKNIGFQTYSQEPNPQIIFFNNLGTKLELYQIDALAKDINRETPPTLASNGFKGITFAINTKIKEEVDELLALAEKNGATIAKKAEAVFWGGYSGYFQDLDGYYWEVAYAENWKFDDQEMLIIEA